MRITSRTKAIAFFITLSVIVLGVAIALNVTWIVLHARQIGMLVLGIIFFAVIIGGVLVTTIFLVREIRRNEQQDSFLNAVTHELKTPVASIRMYLETLERRPLDEAQRREFYRIMLEDTDRLVGTIEQVLRAGEVRHGSDRKHWQQVNFSSLVSDAVDLARLRHHLGAEALHMNATPREEITVRGNPEELRTAVANLIDNAVKYSNGRQEITVEMTTPDIDNVILNVHDRGIGIPPEELKSIFKRFYRIPGRWRSEVKGTGLGLFIVRSIVRRHGGDVSAASEGEGRGSTFSIRLPRVYRV
jgi:two-component system, OmpR family, sensor histidine kinase SenX3